MKQVYWIAQLCLLAVAVKGKSTSLLCGRTKSMELGGGPGTGAALALTLVRPWAPADSDGASGAPAPCKLRLSAPNASAFLVRLIDVKESLVVAHATPDISMLSALGGAGGVAAAAAGAVRKWSSRAAAPAQDTEGRVAASAHTNKTDQCTLSVYIAGNATEPVWRLGLCSAQAASSAGYKVLPPLVKIVWIPPTSPFHNTERLRLVVTVLNSGEICKNSSQFPCGHALDTCVSGSLACDGVWNCPYGEDEDADACERRDPPLVGLLRRLAARNQELLGIEPGDPVTKPSVIMKIGEGEQKTSTLSELTEALKPYGPWGYIMMGVLMCATMIMFVVVWAECCCKRSKPTDDSPLSLDMPAACIDLAPTVGVSASSARSPTPPAYEAPPSYSSLFPRAFKSSPTPEPHCSRMQPPD